MHRWLGAALAVAALAWVGVLVGAPFLPVPLAGVLYAAGSLICHQMPERSFHVDVFQLPVCARCFGLYAGGAVGSTLAAAGPWLGRAAVRACPRRPPYGLTLLAATPTAATLMIEWVFGWPVSNTVRAVAALPLAGTVAFVVVTSVATLHYDECAPRRPIGPGQPRPPARI